MVLPGQGWVYAITVPAESRVLGVVSAFMWAVATEAELGQRQAYRLRLAVDEIVTNIIMHGYADCENCPPIQLWAEIYPNTVSITIQDGGVPFDITQASQPDDLDKPPEQRDVGGLGVFLVVRYIDTIRYEYVNGYNVNRLIIHRD